MMEASGSGRTGKDAWWKIPPLIWFMMGGAVFLLAFVAFDGLKTMVHMWESREEYSYGYLIPFISAFLVWQRKDRLARIPFEFAWQGVVLAVAGLAVLYVGRISATHFFVQYGFLISLMGVVWAFMGGRAFRVVLVPLLFLFFMVPLPGIFLFRLSNELQLISSQIGVAVIRAFGISVYLEGNVIDLGTYKLQVVEACSGLRYLFPLMTLSFMAAYFFRAAFWKRAIVFLSSIPITVLMNSFRIGMIGVLVEYWGIEQAEGFLHDFEGWVVFMACMGLLILEIWALSKIGEGSRSFGDAFRMDFPEEVPEGVEILNQRVPVTGYVAVVVAVLAALGALVLDSRDRPDLERLTFAEFPNRIGEWRGRPDRLEQIYLDALKLDDYLLETYTNPEGAPVNLYVAYYESQEAGSAAHSPKTCIPGGGWEIKVLEEYEVPGVLAGGVPLKVNRLLIQKGNHRQLVYYWFRQRGRNITSEYAVKWYLLVDGAKRNRTDGALVRLTTMVDPSEEVADADRRLAGFAVEVVPLLPRFIPD